MGEASIPRHIVERIAALRGEPINAIADSTTDNARRVYGIGVE